MIIAESHGNILKSNAQTLVCPVNTVGTLGNGLALYFKLNYPEIDDPYKFACFQGHFKREGVIAIDVNDGKKVLCLPTKRHWRNKSRLEWIDAALMKIASDYDKLGITSLAIPAIGCGHGQLEWEPVYNLIKHWLGDNCALPVTVYLPD